LRPSLSLPCYSSDSLADAALQGCPLQTSYPQVSPHHQTPIVAGLLHTASSRTASCHFVATFPAAACTHAPSPSLPHRDCAVRPTLHHHHASSSHPCEGTLESSPRVSVDSRSLFFSSHWAPSVVLSNAPGLCLYPSCTASPISIHPIRSSLAHLHSVAVLSLSPWLPPCAFPNHPRSCCPPLNRYPLPTSSLHLLLRRPSTTGPSLQAGQLRYSARIALGVPGTRTALQSAAQKLAEWDGPWSRQKHFGLREPARHAPSTTDLISRGKRS
jgi:hypothetical protein